MKLLNSILEILSIVVTVLILLIGFLLFATVVVLTGATALYIWQWIVSTL